MGKDSLIKSTAKKTETAKKKAKPKKATKTSASKASAPKSSKKKSQKAQTTKTSAPVEASKPAGKTPAAAAKPSPKPTREALIFKKFDGQRPPVSDKPAIPDFSKMTAPPFIDSEDPDEARRLRDLLFKRFDMADIKAAAKTPVEPPAQVESPAEDKPVQPPKAAELVQTPPVAAQEPAPKPTREALIFKKFDGQRPPVSDKPAAPDFSQMTAPPFIDTENPDEAQRLRDLLFKRFDMADIKAAAKPPVEPAAQVEPPAPADAPVPEEKPAPHASEEPSEKPLEKPAEEPAKEPTPEAKTAAETPVAAADLAPSETEPKKEAATPVQQPRTEAPHLVEAARVETRPDKEPPDPVLRAAKIGAIIAAAIFLLIIWTSYTNSGRYFILPQRGAVEIWKGNFSPTGKQFFAVLHGYQLAEPVQDIYRQKDVFPIIFGYYLNKADALLETSGLPDYKAIADYLDRAEQYALSEEMRAEVEHRKNNIQRMTLYYKAEVDASKNTVESLTSALDNLARVQRLTTDPTQLSAIEQKIASVTAALEAAKIRQAEEAAAQQAETPTEAETRE